MCLEVRKRSCVLVNTVAQAAISRTFPFIKDAPTARFPTVAVVMLLGMLPEVSDTMLPPSAQPRKSFALYVAAIM
jgi:hypothetical protein